MPGNASAGDEQDQGETLTRVTVGGLLRAERERRNLTLDDVAANVRIRRTQLDAIENGRFNELPGAPYAVGFVRTYAEFLDLDRDEVIRRFKAETAGLDNPKELHFPRPLSESRLPGGVVLLISLVIAAGAYGFWYFHGASERAPLPRVAAVPDRLAPLADPVPHQAEAPPKEAAAPADLAAPSSDTTASAPAVPSPASSAETPAAPAETPTVAAAPATPPVSPSPGPEAAPPGSVPAAAQAPTPAPTSTATPASVPAAPTDASQASAIPSAPADSSSQPRVYGEAAGSRVVIHATADSWVQIRDPGGNVLFTRLLRTGDSYNVPNRQGLLLYTGSAGALEIRVDGRAIPPFGKTGTVKRDMPLDPDRLLASGATPPEQARPTSSGG